MKDQLVKALVLDGRVRVYTVRSTDMVQEAQNRFHLFPTPTAALGRVLSVASIMGSMLKSDKEMLTININGGGPIGSIVVDAYPNGNVRGFVSNPQAEAAPVNGHLNVGGIVGTEGTLTVTKDLSMEENWSGTVDLQTGEIGQDFAYYFTLSEQTPTAVSVGVRLDKETGKVKAAGALVLQMLPDATEMDISICEHVLEGLKPMSEIIEHYDDVSMADFVHDMFEDANILSTQDVAFKCNCSKEKTAAVLATLAPAELEAMIAEDQGAAVTCNFCNETYQFTTEELQRLLDHNLKDLEITQELEDDVPEN